MTQAVKFSTDQSDTLEGLGIPFGGPVNGTDFDGEFFTKNTDFSLDWFQERPLLYHHGLDDAVQAIPVGRVKSFEVRDDLGIWTKVQLDRSSKYFDAIKDLVGKGKLFFSSGSIQHLVKKLGSGEYTRWPWVELSLTPNPSNLLAVVSPDTAQKHFKSVGLTFTIPIAGSYSDRAVGSYESRIWELSQALNHRDPTLPDGYPDYFAEIVSTHPDFVLVRLSSPDAFGKSHESYWKVEYECCADPDCPDCPVLGDREQVSKAFVPSGALLKEAPLVTYGELSGKFAAALLRRTKDVVERRVAEGRDLSRSNKRSLLTAADALDEASRGIKSILVGSSAEAESNDHVKLSLEYSHLKAAILQQEQ
jgi:hypothetical protein